MKEEDTDVTTGDNVKAYVFNGVVLDLDTDSGTGSFPGNIVVVTGVAAKDDSLNGDQIKVRYFDGSTKTVTLADDVNFKPVVGVAYKASGSDSAFKVEKLEAKKYNGYEAAIYGVTDDTSLTADKKLDANPDNDKIGGLKVSDDAAIILFDGEGRSKQITGKQFNAMVNSDANLGENGVDHVYASFTKESNGLTRVMMASVLVNSTSITGQSSDNYGYIVTEGARTPSGDTKYTIWTGSENVTVTEDTSYARGDRAKGTLIGYSSITDGTINDVTKYGTVKSAKSVTKDMSLNTTDLYRAGNEAKSATTYIAVNGNQFNVTADTTVLLVDSKADDDSKIGLKYTYKDKLPQAEELKKNEWSVNAFWLMDEAGTDDVDIEVLVIDSTGVFDGMKDTTTGDDTTVTTGDVKISNAKVNGNNKLEANVSITRPDYVPESATVPVTFDVYVDGSKMGSETATVGANNSSVFYVSNNSYPTSGTLEIKNVKMGTASAVNVKYVDDKGNDVTSKLVKDSYTKTLATGNTGANIKFTVSTSTTAPISLKYGITGLTSDVDEKSFTTGNNSEQTESGVAAKGTGYVTVKITGLDKLVETYKIEKAADLDSVKLGDFGVTGTDDKEYTLEIGATLTTGIAENQKVALTAKLGTAPTNAHGYKVTVTLDGKTYSAVLTNTDETRLSPLVVVNKDITINKADVAVETVAKVAVAKDKDGNAKVSVADGTAYTIEFNQNIALADGTTEAAFTGTNGTPQKCLKAEVSGNKLILTMDKSIASGEALKFAVAKIVSADDKNNALTGTGTNAKLTYTSSSNTWALAFEN